MKAIRVHEVGGPEKLVFEEIPIPNPGPDQARVEIKAIGLNFIDVYFRTGLYKASLPFTPFGPRCADLDRLSPFGIGNPFPILATRNVPISAGPWVLKEKHLKFRSNGAGVPLDVIWWQNGDRVANLGTGDTLDVVYTLSRDTYRGREKLLLTLRDLREV